MPYLIRADTLLFVDIPNHPACQVDELGAGSVDRAFLLPPSLDSFHFALASKGEVLHIHNARIANSKLTLQKRRALCGPGTGQSDGDASVFV